MLPINTIGAACAVTITSNKVNFGERRGLKKQKKKKISILVILSLYDLYISLTPITSLPIKPYLSYF